MGGFPARLRARYGHDEPILRPHELPPIALAAAFTLVIAFGAITRTVGYNAVEVGSAFLNAFLLWLCGLASELIGMKRIGQCNRLAATFAMLAFGTAWASDVFAAISLPYADDALAATDARLFGGFDWPTMVAALRPHTNVLGLLSHAYTSLNWQPMLLLIALCCIRKPETAWRFLTAWAIALAVCLLVFPFCPAVGGYVHFHIAQGTMPGVEVPSAWAAAVPLENLRSGALRSLDYSSLNGLITMPSFHAAAAVLLAWGYSHVRWLRWPFLALNILMIVSAVPVGGHYLVDVFAGAIVAGLSIVIANLWTGVMSGRQSSPDLMADAFAG